MENLTTSTANDDAPYSLPKKVLDSLESLDFHEMEVLQIENGETQPRRSLDPVLRRPCELANSNSDAAFSLQPVDELARSRLRATLRSTGFREKDEMSDYLARLLSHDRFEDVAFELAGRMVEAQGYLDNGGFVMEIEVHPEIAFATDMLLAEVAAKSH